jgi:hypothetical protein
MIYITTNIEVHSVFGIFRRVVSVFKLEEVAMAGSSEILVDLPEYTTSHPIRHYLHSLSLDDLKYHT